MKIGVIGTGRMSSGLCRRWALAGHDVMFGSRDGAKAAALAAEITQRHAPSGSLSGGSGPQAVDFGAVILLGTPWNVTGQALRDLGGPEGALAGKIVIDVTNALAEDGTAALPGGTSAAEQIAGWAPGAQVIKAFNGIYFPYLDGDPAPKGSTEFAATPTVFFAGDDASACETARTLIEDAGFPAVMSGPLITARHLEWLAALWIYMAFRGGRGPGFQLTLRQG